MIISMLEKVGLNSEHATDILMNSPVDSVSVSALREHWQ